MVVLFHSTGWLLSPSQKASSEPSTKSVVLSRVSTMILPVTAAGIPKRSLSMIRMPTRLFGKSISRSGRGTFWKSFNSAVPPAASGLIFWVLSSVFFQRIYMTTRS